MLFKGAFERITSSMGLIATDVDTAAACYQSWQNEILDKFGMRISALPKGRVNVKTALESLLPLTTPIPTRYLFLVTNSKWTVFFDNSAQGTDAASAMVVMAGKLRCEALRVVRREQTLAESPSRNAKGQYGATILEVYAADGATRRAIYAVNDGGKWKFGQSGMPFIFEVEDAYHRKAVKERFTNTMLLDYLAKLDADPFNEHWYTGESVLLKKEGDLPETLVEHSL